MKFKDHFSRQAAIYAKSRPTYPEELFEFLVSISPSQELCWDCATGNGQAAVSLSKYFKKIIATDGSASQIQNAEQVDNIVYKVATAEDSGLADHSVDLITVATAAHWFNHGLFYKEAKRVAKQNGILALWTYGVATINPKIDELTWWFMEDLLKGYWPSGREYVMQEYKTLPFPFDEIKTPEFFCRLDWGREHWLNYLRSWSGYVKYVTDKKSDPMEELIPRLEPLWKDGEVKKVVWPLHVKCARL